MKLLDLKCPDCGGAPIGAADWTPGLVEFDLEPDGTFIDYRGGTEMFWDGQDNSGPPGFMEVQCEKGHTWLTRLEYDDCEHKEAKYNTRAGTGWCPRCGGLYSVATGWRVPELPPGPTSWPALLTQRIEQAIAQLVRDGNVSLAAAFAAQAAASYYGDMVRETKSPLPGRSDLAAVLEMAEQPHSCCNLESDSECEAEQYGDGNGGEHYALRQARAALDAPGRPNLVVVTVEGGLLSTVSAERPLDVRVVGVDFDVEGTAPDHPGMFALPRTGETEAEADRAGVYEHPVGPIHPLARRWVDALDAVAAAST